jgi:coenzyme F420-dependent glucose-6-phosphate dehydrogenase
VLVAADLPRHTEWLRELAALGFASIQLHHVGRDLAPFIDAFGSRVLPELAA